MKQVSKVVFALCWLAGFSVARAERINHEGRILGPLPVVATPTLFNTTNADAIVSAMQIFPVDNAWNEDISQRPVLPNSDAMINRIISDLASTRRSLRVFKEMNYVLVPDSQPNVPINFLDYPAESDPSPYPIPANMPIEQWPSETGGLTLEQWQEDINNTGGDRHSIVVKPGSGFIWETWQARRIGTNWQASNGAKFNINSNGLRPLGWTSGDAAGLAMFPALVRYDECQRGMVEHAVRIVVARSRREYIYPATHYASSDPASMTNIPAMGQRLRLKASFQIPTNWTVQEQALLKGLKKYGAIVADNGGFFSISIAPDDRWPANAWSHISSIGITNFEVIQTTGPTGGPRSPGAPSVNAGLDQTLPGLQAVQLNGSINYTGTAPIVTRWKAYSGPGTVTFGNSLQTNTTATFSAPGVYTLMLSASNGVHAVAYDALVITLSNRITLSASRNAGTLNLSWTGGSPPYVIERSPRLHPGSWSGVFTTATQNAAMPMTGSNAFFRIKGQ